MKSANVITNIKCGFYAHKGISTSINFVRQQREERIRTRHHIGCISERCEVFTGCNPPAEVNQGTTGNDNTVINAVQES